MDIESADMQELFKDEPIPLVMWDNAANSKCLGPELSV